MTPRKEQPADRQPQGEPGVVQLEKPVYGGACLARVEGKAVFVPLTLPGEQARVRVVESKPGYSTAEAEEIVVAAPQRVSPRCPHFGACGGCQYQHADYPAQLEMKQAILRETLDRGRGGVTAPERIDVLSAAPWGYRNRIRLAFDAAGNAGYRGRRSHEVVAIRECPIAAPLLVEAALASSEVVRFLRAAPRLRELALFVNESQTAVLASLTVASGTKIHLEQVAPALRARIPSLAGMELLVEGRHGELSRTVARWGDPSLLYRAGGFGYRVDQGAFFQVNRHILDTFVERVTGRRQGALAWDLFAGVGLFARRLADRFARVAAVESAPAAIPALAANLKGSHGAPVRATTLNFLERSYQGQRPDLVVVDPPRAGLGPAVCELLGKVAAPEMVYVSCDPATLARDLRTLAASGYGVESVTLADLFPQTFHMETVTVLRRA